MTTAVSSCHLDRMEPGMVSQITSLSLKLVAFIQYFTIATRNKIKAENGTKSWANAVLNMAMWLQMELFCGKNVEVFGTLV